MQIQPKRSQEPQSLNFTRPCPSRLDLGPWPAFIVSTLETVLGPFIGQNWELLPVLESQSYYCLLIQSLDFSQTAESILNFTEYFQFSSYSSSISKRFKLPIFCFKNVWLVNWSSWRKIEAKFYKFLLGVAFKTKIPTFFFLGMFFLCSPLLSAKNTVHGIDKVTLA